MGRWIGLSRTVGSTGSTHPAAATIAGGTARRRASRDAGDGSLPRTTPAKAACRLLAATPPLPTCGARWAAAAARSLCSGLPPLRRAGVALVSKICRRSSRPQALSVSPSLPQVMPSSSGSLSRSTSLPHLDNAVMSQSSCVRSLRAPPKHTTKQIWRPAFKALVERAVIHLLPQLQLEQRLLREQQPAGDAGVAVKVLDAKKHKVRSFISLFQWNSRLASFLMELDSKT